MHQSFFIMNVKDKNILVVGLGVSGYAAAKLLLSRGAKVFVTEEGSSEEIVSRRDELIFLGAEVEIGGHTEQFSQAAELLVVSPGISMDSVLVQQANEKNIPVIGEMELGFKFCKAPIIAITGTNGKSTTTELIGNILVSSGVHSIVCGNIGNPLSGEVDKLTEESIAVVEVSSFQLETIRDFRPSVAVLLNVAEDHYDRHLGFQNYKEAKFEIFKNQTNEDYAIVHAGLSNDALISVINAKTLFFGDDNSNSFLSGGSVFVDFSGKKEGIITAAESPLKGDHNIENIEASALAAVSVGIAVEDVKKGIMTFSALSHRFQRIGEFGGVEFIDDSKATNIDATRRALESLDKKTVLIAGGIDKGGDYFSVKDLMKRKVKAMVLIGEASEKLENEFSDDIPVFSVSTMPDAVKKASEISSKGEVVLLSPMCSSFDMFSSYKERGEVFQRAVKELNS